MVTEDGKELRSLSCVQMANLNFNTKSALKGTFSVEVQIRCLQEDYSTQARRLVFAWAGSFSLKTDR